MNPALWRATKDAFASPIYTPLKRTCENGNVDEFLFYGASYEYNWSYNAGTMQYRQEVNENIKKKTLLYYNYLNI